MRLNERIAHTQTPDNIHIHQVYAKNPLKTEFVASAQGLSGVAIARKESNAPGQTISADIYTTNGIEIPSLLTISPTEIRLSFEPQKQSKNKPFTITIDALGADKTHALLLPYESDATKYPGNSVWQNEDKKQGSLGITQYERPTIALSLVRWLALPHQRTLWLGVGLCVIGICINKFRAISVIPGLTRDPRVRQLADRFRLGGRNDKLGYYVVIFISILIVYWPATKLFFYSDDVPILARTEVLKTTNPLLLFTPYQYHETDTHAKFGFDFWRPVSFTAYPLLLSLIPGAPNAQLYYLINIILFAVTGCFLFAIAYHLLKSHALALLATTIWAFHSTKLGVVYWWSSSQDILASLFAMGAIVLYLKNKHKPALAFYMLGMLSKEYVIVTPLIIAGIELLDKRGFLRQPGMTSRLSGFISVAGLFLILNTIALGNPWIFKDSHANTYAFSLKPLAISRNIAVYASASAESRIWPTSTISNKTEQLLDSTLELWRAKTSGPYYPSIILIAVWLLSIIIFFRSIKLRNTILFGGMWWAIFLGPILLFANDWKPRWLMLSIFGIGLCVAAIAQRIRLPKILAYSIAIFLIIYGFQAARSEHLTRFYRQQSDYTRNALQQLQEQEKTGEYTKRIILMGITEEQRTSLNAYLFRVYTKNPQADIIYADSTGGLPRVAPSTDGRSGDIIINMSGSTPYYPESEK